jgi:hypothetical protein
MGRSGSSSQANQQTSTSSADSRIVNESGIVARDSHLDLSTNTNITNRSWDASSTVTNTDNSIYSVTADPEIAKAAFDFAKGNDATLGAGLANVLTFAKDITNKSSDNNRALAGQFSDSATTLASRFSDGVAQAFDSARNTTPGGIDNKTMIVLGVAGAAALAAIASKRG